jgi:hypothetical protein
MCFDNLVLVVVIVIVVMMMMFVCVYGNELAVALIMPMDPVMMFAKMPGDPHPFITLIPIPRTLGVIRLVAYVDREIDRHDA